MLNDIERRCYQTSIDCDLQNSGLNASQLRDPAFDLMTHAEQLLVIRTLAAVDGHSDRDIAWVTGWPLDQVRSALAR